MRRTHVLLLRKVLVLSDIPAPYNVCVRRVRASCLYILHTAIARTLYMLSTCSAICTLIIVVYVYYYYSTIDYYNIHILCTTRSRYISFTRSSSRTFRFS
eukprot:COSAG03_NODE_14745_length_453_cov_1.449153_2_plen_99_part_01